MGITVRYPRIVDQGLGRQTDCHGCKNNCKTQRHTPDCSKRHDPNLGIARQPTIANNSGNFREENRMILNLTQHLATPEQAAAGVVDLQGDQLQALKRALTFDTLPTQQEVQDRAFFIVRLAFANALGDDMDADPMPTHAMIGGAPFLMSALESALLDECVRPVYAFSVRQSVEAVQPDGSVVKTAIFKHMGFYNPTST
jgi:hypothetical protein